MKALKARLFFRGVRIEDMKHLAEHSPSEVLPEPDEVAISMSQSIGKPAIVCVAVGDKVKEGQLIGKADGAISTNVFSSIAGDVTDVKTVTTVEGKNETVVFIKSDKSGQKAWLNPIENPSVEQIIERVRDAGVVGLGGAGFPTAAKLTTQYKVNTLIINGAECEPYLTCDDRLLKENPEGIVKGAKYLAKALGVSEIIIAIEANKPDCIEKFSGYEDIKVVELKQRYPMGGEKQLVYVTTGKKVGLGKLPASVGVSVNNVATCFSVYEAIELGKPLYESIVTVSGQAVKTPKNVRVRLGTPLKNIIEYCGGQTENLKKLVIGGPMTGNALASDAYYTYKTASGILLFSGKEVCEDEPTACLSCGKCADVCPMKLMPMQTDLYAQFGEFEAAAKFGNVAYCIECGACEYVCPARRPLVQQIRKTKAAIRNKN